MLNNVYLDIDVDESYLNVNKDIKIYIFSNSYNILKIMGGQADLLFT